MPGDLIRVDKRELLIPVGKRAGRDYGDTIRITNVASSDVALKMMATNPRHYIVRPNILCVPPGETHEIRVQISDAVASTASPGPSRDRFQLRAALAPGLSQAHSQSPADFWREHGEKAAVIRIRFTVQFAPSAPHSPPSNAQALRDLVVVDKHEIVIPVGDGAGLEHGDTVRVTNVANDDVALKMKTTNPMQFIVRPSLSCVAPRDTAELRVIMSPAAAAVSPPGPSRDRFQLSAALAPGLSKSVTPANFWRQYRDETLMSLIHFTVRFTPLTSSSRPGSREPKSSSKLVARPPSGISDSAAKTVTDLKENLEQNKVELARIEFVASRFP